MENVILFIICLGGAHLFYKNFQYLLEVEKTAKEVVKKYNDRYNTCYTYLEFAKIEKRNPGWLSYGPVKQNQLLNEHGESTLLYSSVL